MQLNRSVCPDLSDQFGLEENGTFGVWIKSFRIALLEVCLATVPTQKLAPSFQRGCYS